MPAAARHLPRLVALLLVVAAGLALPVTSASAHGFSSVVYADVSSGGSGHVRVRLGLEYDLLVVSSADAEHDDPLFRAGTAAFDAGEARGQAAALDAHRRAVDAYVAGRLRVADPDGSACRPSRVGPAEIRQRDGVPYAFLAFDYRCPEAPSSHEITSGLFPDGEGYVRGTKTIVLYDLDLRSGSASLEAGHSTFSTAQSLGQRYSEFFRLGAEHLLTGIDHILFLLALIVGSRRLREIVLAASSFTLAHSVTFILAALGVVHVPSGLVEPTIALSIAVVAGVHLWRIWETRRHPTDADGVGSGLLGLDRAGWIRLAVVFCFGLVHGLGFASALGIDQAFSWTLLSSLLVFNLGIESVQLGIILLVFPLLTLLRHRAPLAGIRTTGTVAAGVAAMGLIWFAQRV